MKRIRSRNIAFSQLPKLGVEFVADKNDTELAQHLHLLLQENEYQVQLELQDEGEGFRLKGFIKAEIPLECAFCCEDFTQSVKLSINELLFPQLLQKSKAEDLDLAAGLKATEFDFFDYIYEQIGFQIPYQAKCPTRDCNKDILQEINSRELQLEENASAFAGLRNLKFPGKPN